MGEIKSVKVDNWGVFFLQKLHNFFNKTDYCDLILQFNDNSQLKVHKLVLSACTDYFNVLEQTCEMIDDTLIMPNELQADLVVPIVNFMYTGTLEFELKMYGKLLKTARDMNMTVLLKLLEAHRRTMEGGPKQVLRNYNTKTSPRGNNYLNVSLKSPTTTQLNRSNTERISTTATTQQSRRRIMTSTNNESYKKLNIKPATTSYSTSSDTNLAQSRQNTQGSGGGGGKGPIKGPSRFEFDGEQETFDSSFDAISYESKPLKEEILEDNDNINLVETKQDSNTSSPFEQLRRTGYTNNKRPASSILQSPPAKKPNIQDVKEYAEQQRMRKQIAEEYGEEYDDTMDDEFHNDDADDDDEYILPSIQKPVQQFSPKKQQQTVKKGTPNKQENKPTIVVKDTTSSNVDHAKIISEVLRKYPHLIKNNKNIKLKIMPNTSGSGAPQRVVIKKETEITSIPSSSSATAITKNVTSKLPEVTVSKVTTTVPLKKVVTTSLQTSTTTGAAATPQTTQPRRIDSKTMKTLIALGPENTTGPWLCLRCGVNGRPISIPSYRGFRRHLVNTHKEKIDSRLCEHCGWRSTNQKELAFHMEMEHQIKSNINFPKCEHCGLVFVDLNSLDDHVDEQHLEKKEENQQCIYCNKTFSAEQLLYNHMKAQHKDRAREDGVIDFSDDEQSGDFDEDESYEQAQPSSSGIGKIQILSDINLPKCISLTQLRKSDTLTTITMQANADAESLNIATSLGLVDSQNDGFLSTASTTETDGPKFVNAEGNLMELTAAQRDEIISQLEQGGDGVVMVLNDESFVTQKTPTTNKVAETSTTDMSSITSQHYDDENMLIDYDGGAKTGDKVKSVEKDAEMDWKNEEDSQDNSKDGLTEPEISELNSAKNSIEKEDHLGVESKDNSDLDMKLKLLTGDWTEDEEGEEGASVKDTEEDMTEMNDHKILDILGKENDSKVDEFVKENMSEEEKAIISKSIDTKFIDKTANENKKNFENTTSETLDTSGTSEFKETTKASEKEQGESELEEFEKEDGEGEEEDEVVGEDDDIEEEEGSQEEVLFGEEIDVQPEHPKSVDTDMKSESIKNKSIEKEAEEADADARNDVEELLKTDKIELIEKNETTTDAIDNNEKEKTTAEDEKCVNEEGQSENVKIKEIITTTTNVEYSKEDADDDEIVNENIDEDVDMYKEEDSTEIKGETSVTDSVAPNPDNNEITTLKTEVDTDDHHKLISMTEESSEKHDEPKEQSIKETKEEVKHIINEWGDDEDDDEDL